MTAHRELAARIANDLFSAKGGRLAGDQIAERAAAIIESHLNTAYPLTGGDAGPSSTNQQPRPAAPPGDEPVPPAGELSYEAVRARAEGWANVYMALREKAGIEIDPWSMAVAAYLESWAATDEAIAAWNRRAK